MLVDREHVSLEDSFGKHVVVLAGPHQRNEDRVEIPECHVGSHTYVIKLLLSSPHCSSRKTSGLAQEFHVLGSKAVLRVGRAKCFTVSIQL